jgi:hypothetical protein
MVVNNLARLPPTLRIKVNAESDPVDLSINEKIICEILATDIKGIEEDPIKGHNSEGIKSKTQADVKAVTVNKNIPFEIIDLLFSEYDQHKNRIMKF